MFGERIHRFLFLFGTCALFAGVMLGTVPTSVPQFILLGNWLLEGKLKEKFTMLRYNKIFWILAGVWMAHVFGLLYTADLKAGWDDIRTKIPLVFLPIVFFTTRVLDEKEIKWALHSFIAGAALNAIWCLLYKKFFFTGADIREVSRFMSHIRLGFLLCLALVFSLYYLKITKHKMHQWIYIGFVLFFLFTFYELGLASGLVNLLTLCTVAILYYTYKRKIKVFTATVILIVGLLFATAWYIYSFYQEYFTPHEGGANIQLKWSPSGRAYNGYEFTKQLENGNLATRNVQDFELQQEWNRRVPHDSFNLSIGHNVGRFYTLLRYLSSKGQTKDSVSVHQLSNDELHWIQQGVCNALVKTWPSLKQRLYELLYEYYDYNLNGTIDGHSFTMRYFYFQAAIDAIWHEWPFGCGTGDVQQAMYSAFERMEIPLDPAWQKRPHNQFLTISLATGLHGIVLFLLSIFYPLWYYRKQLNWLYGFFFVSVFVSFLFEDTLETQIGLSFYAIFNTFFLAQLAIKKKQTLPD